MADDAVRSRLGRGLAALIGEAETGSSGSATGTRRVPVEFIRRNPNNPRSHFSDESLEELAASIRERGIIQPIVVRAMPHLRDVFEIIAGERRWRAAQRAGLHEVPVVTVEVDDKTALEFAIVENIQRSDLNAIEEASGYERLIAEHGYTQTDLATSLGKSRSHVANTLRLLKLPAGVKDRVVTGEISPGHARALLAVPDPEAVAARVAAEGLTVRDVEGLARAESQGDAPDTRRRGRREIDPDTRAAETALEEALGLAVRIDHRGDAGEVRIRYRTLDQLDDLSRRLKAG